MAPTDRNTHWFSVAAFSTIALVSIIDEFPSGENIKDQEKETKWAVSAVSVALIFSALAVFANLLLKEKFVGTLMEGALVSCSENCECRKHSGSIPRVSHGSVAYFYIFFPGDCYLWFLGQCSPCAHGT